MAVTIKIRHTTQFPASWKSRAEVTADVDVVVQIPHCCLTRAGVKHPVRPAIAVKVGYYSPGSAAHQRMRVSIRRVARHGRVVEVIPACDDGRATVYRAEVYEIVVLISVVPRVTRLGCLLHPPRIIPVHRACLGAEARLVEDSDRLVNLVRVADRETLRMPLFNPKPVLRVCTDDRCCS